jgi:DNA polymerase-3 subunit beta
MSGSLWRALPNSLLLPDGKKEVTKMNITCEASALCRALALVKPAVPGRPRVPILANVLLRAVDGRLRLAATDLGLGIACWLPAETRREGAVAVPYARLAAWLSGLARPGRSGKGAGQQPAAPTVVALSVDPDSRRVEVSCGRRKATIPGERPEDFPGIPTFEEVAGAGATVFACDLPLFCHMVEQVGIASDPRDPRQPYGRLALRVEAGRMTLAARNEGTLAQCAGAMQVGTGGQFALALPAQDSAKVARVLQGLGLASVQVAVERQWPRVLFHTPGLDLVMSLYEQEFPDLGQLVPTTARTLVVVDRAALAAALDFVAFVARRNGHEVSLRAGPGTLLVEARDKELGEQATEIEVASAEDAAGFRCAPLFGLLSQLVATAAGPTISLEWYAEPGTLVLRSQLDSPACLTTYVIPPLKAAGQGGRI